MAIRSRGIKKDYADEMNLDGVATQKEMDDAFTEHIDDYHTADGLLPAPEEDNMILKSYENDDEELAWKTVVADDPDEGLTVIALPYYWDEDRQKYLDNQTVRVTVYMSGNADDEWLYCIPRIRSDSVPYKMLDSDKMCITEVQFFTSEKTSGDVIEIRNITGYISSVWGRKTALYDTIYTVSLDDTTDTYVDSSVDIDLEGDISLGGYAIDGADLEDPVCIVIMRKVWEKEDDS